MEFYQDLSQFYEYIFPLGGGKVKFVERYFRSGQSVLDVGCGTGELVLELVRAGFQGSGMDLSADMISKARTAAQSAGLQADFQVGDMRQLPELYHEPFDGIICFGNTIVHLTDMTDLQEFFREVAGLLRPGGYFLFQIVNYDRILSHKVRELPLIENPEKQLTFYRMYEHDAESGLIHFNTRLVVEGEVKAEHSVPLYPLTSGEIREMLAASGFAEPTLFGNFAQERYVPDESMALVCAVRKAE